MGKWGFLPHLLVKVDVLVVEAPAIGGRWGFEMGTESFSLSNIYNSMAAAVEACLPSLKIGMSQLVDRSLSFPE